MLYTHVLYSTSNNGNHTYYWARLPRPGRRGLRGWRNVVGDIIKFEWLKKPVTGLSLLVDA